MTINIRDRAALVIKALEQQQHDPLLELINAAKNKDLALEDRIAINKELLQYMAPKLKAVDLNANVDLDAEIKVVSYKDMTAAEADAYSQGMANASAAGPKK